jgi:hypothetical protein
MVLRSASKKLPKFIYYVRGFTIALLVIAILGFIIEWLKRL